MVKRTMGEMITHFNDTVSTMDISINDKMILLGMITAIGYECQKAADAIEELQKPKWIPVTERLPEVGQNVLFSYRSCIKKQPRIFIGWYIGKQWNSLFATDYDVTHWMPLPQPPKEETDG